MHRFLKISLVAAALVSAPVVAEAADPTRPSYRGPVPYYDWSGFYVGAHAGVGWSDSDFGESGFIGGGQVGFNHQVGQWVFGVEGEFSGTSIKESFNIPGIASADLSVDWISTFAFRAGWAFDRWLVYGKFGGAWASVSGSASLLGVPIASVDDTVSGWVFGVGTEYALQNNWTAKLEYNMMDFGNDQLDGKVHVLKGGVNYRFGYGRY